MLQNEPQNPVAHRLRALADEIVGHDVLADLEVRIGQPAEEIVAAARESKCDSIMLSTRRITGFDRYLIRSVAHRGAQLADCPVVLLRPRKTFAGSKAKTPICVAPQTRAQIVVVNCYHSGCFEQPTMIAA